MRLETCSRATRFADPVIPLVVCGRDAMRLRELQESVACAPVGSRRLGVRSGDRVVIYLPNGIEFVQAVYADFALGGIAVPVNTKLTADEVEYMFADAAPAAAIYHARGREGAWTGRRGSFPDAVQHLGRRRGARGDRIRSRARDACGGASPSGRSTDDDCLIMYTSGTTGTPKGAVLTHANMIVQNVLMHGTEWAIGRDDRYLVVTPLAHRAGVSRLFNALGLGGTLVILDEVRCRGGARDDRAGAHHCRGAGADGDPLAAARAEEGRRRAALRCAGSSFRPKRSPSR